jgi:hypothetical protein
MKINTKIKAGDRTGCGAPPPRFPIPVLEN